MTKQLLPDEVMICMYKYMSLRDIYILQLTNMANYKQITRISDYILTEELKRYDYPITKDDVYVLVTVYLQDKYLQSFQNITRNLTCPVCKLDTQVCVCQTKYFNEPTVREYMNTIEYWERISPFVFVNNLFRVIYLHFLKNNRIADYTNKITLLFFYNLLQTHIFRNTRNVNYNIHFLNDFSERSHFFRPIADSYFRHIIRNGIRTSFENLYIISRFTVNLETLKRLFGCYAFDLSNSEFVECCRVCFESSIAEIVQFKFNRTTDELLSHNYNQIKTFFRTHKRELSKIMDTHELQLVNQHVTYQCPSTGETLRLQSMTSQKLLFTLKYEMPYKTREYRQIEKQISRRQHKLRRLHFS